MTTTPPAATPATSPSASPSTIELSARAMGMLQHPDPDVRLQALELYRSMGYPAFPAPLHGAFLVLHGSFLTAPEAAADIDYLYDGLAPMEAAARLLRWVAVEYGADSPHLQLPLDGRVGRTVPTWRNVAGMAPIAYRIPPHPGIAPEHVPPPLYRQIHGRAVAVRVRQFHALSSSIREAAALSTIELTQPLRRRLEGLEELYLETTGPEFGGYTSDGPAALRRAWRKLSAAQRHVALDALPAHWRPVWRHLIDEERPPPASMLSALRRYSGAGGVLLHWSRHLLCFTGQHGGRLPFDGVLEALDV